MSQSIITRPARNNGLDLLKLICAFLVVTIHVITSSVPDSILIKFLFICRAAVPVFFIITGYYYSSTVAKNREKKQIFKILKLCIAANVFFLTFGNLFRVFTGSLHTFIFDILLKPATLIYFFVFNWPPAGGTHLWYLSALLYVLVLVFFLQKLIKSSKLKFSLMVIAVVLLLAANFALGEFKFLTGLESEILITRNFLLTGLPLFFIGILLFKFKEFFNKIPTALAVPLLFLSFTAGYCEAYFSPQKDLYVSTVFSAVLLFIIFNRINIGENVFSSWGNKYSLGIYVIHTFFIGFYNLGVSKLGFEILLYNAEPIFIFAASLVISIIFENVKSRVIAFTKSKRST
jgi:peptidoglycan/LPS O-acetylase OafA/YrhL